MNKKQIRNILITAILVSILCSVSFYMGVNSAYVGTVSEVWVNPPFSEASYVIGQYNSTYYYAKNSTTGKFDYLSTNTSYVLQAAINALTNGGKIFIKAGIYTLNSMLTISTNEIELVGEGMSTELRGSAGTTTYLIKTENAGYLKISDLCLNLYHSATDGGLYIYNTYSSILENLFIWGIANNDARIGILIDRDTGDPLFSAAYWNKFNNLFIRTFGTGIKITNNANAQSFVIPEIRDVTTGINVDNGDGVRIAEGFFETFIGNAINVNDNWASIVANRFETASAGAVGVNITANSNYACLTGNHYYIPNGSKVVNAGVRTILDDPYFKNSGTATISASTSVTFNHGLVGTPVHVEVGWQDLGYGTWMWSANSTQITITVSVSGTYDFSWYAEYNP